MCSSDLTLATHMQSELKDSAVRFNYLLPQMTKRMGESGEKLFDLIGKLVKAAGDKEHEMLAYEMLRHSNFENVLYDVFTDTVQAFTEPLMDAVTWNAIQSNSSICDQYCEGIIPSTECILCNVLVTILENVAENVQERVESVLTCMDEFDPIDFENNVQWLKCFYSCE